MFRLKVYSQEFVFRSSFLEGLEGYCLAAMGRLFELSAFMGAALGDCF